MTNRYAANCVLCGNLVPKNGGTLKRRGKRWEVTHLSCEQAKSPAVRSFYFPTTGNTIIQNVNGRCEDAPCCGCCS
jgi:hypothetical protein